MCSLYESNKKKTDAWYIYYLIVDVAMGKSSRDSCILYCKLNQHLTEYTNWPVSLCEFYNSVFIHILCTRNTYF